MRITVNYCLGQFILAVFISFICAGCIRNEAAPVIPPLTSPLSKDYIGYGVITASFSHITLEPAEESPSLGYLRRGSLVRVIRRQTIRVNNSFVSWVQLDNYQNGWLKEEVMDIYVNENQARTASESMLK